MKEEDIDLFLYGIFLNVSMDVNDKNEKDWTEMYCYYYDGSNIHMINSSFLDETRR